MQKALISLAVVLLIAAGYAYSQLGPLNGPARPPPRDQWEALLRERIKLPDGYSFQIFARDLGRLRLMQMTENGDLIVSGYRDGNILLVKADRDGTDAATGKKASSKASTDPMACCWRAQRFTWPKSSAWRVMISTVPSSKMNG